MKLKTKFIMSVISLSFALFSVIGSTYAWFSMNTTVNVVGMELTATVPTNLLIKNSTNGIYSNIVDADEDFGSNKLCPASSADGKTRFNAVVGVNCIGSGAGGVAEDDTTFQLSSDQAGSTVVELSSSSNGYWATYTFALHISEEQEAPVSVYLSTLDFYTRHASDGAMVSDGACYSYDGTTFTVIDNGETIPQGAFFKKDGIANASRCALYTGATEGALTTLVGIYSNVADNTTKPVSSAITVEDTTYASIKASNNTVVASEVAGSTHTFDVNNSDVFVTLVVWLEGQDTDCVNVNAGQTFKIDVAFSVLEN